MPTSDQKIKTLKTVRGKDINIKYTQDNFEESIVTQRQYFDDNGAELTPITPLLLSRQVVGANSPTAARFGSSQLRHISVCFGSSNNTLGESNFKVVVPYAPGDPIQAEQIRETRDYVSPSQFLAPKTPLKLVYHGENNG
ncbi:hypothetical protein [Microcoleus sp. Pol10D4]|uniref:hypothetical protein n=1 Tax=Microcoleus sp. Pol10D4 TaxID=3055387 RepID=UPI002FCEEFFB